MNILKGKKVILVPIMWEEDFEYLFSTYAQEKGKKLYDLSLNSKDATITNLLNLQAEGVFVGWIIYSNKGRKSKKVGVIFVLDNAEHKVEVNGALDKEFLKGLAKKLTGREPGYTYAEEAMFLVTRFCFSILNKERVEANIDGSNRLAIRLAQKVGYRKEGVLRKFIRSGDKFMDVCILSMLKEDYENGESQPTKPVFGSTEDLRGRSKHARSSTRISTTTSGGDAES